MEYKQSGRFMFKEVGNSIAEIQQHLKQEREWLKSFSKLARNIDFLETPWMETHLVHSIPQTIPSITRVSGVDGGLIFEALAGIDLIIYRAVGVTFTGIGKKVDATYTPSFDPEHATYIGPSLPSRQEFLKLGILYRLLIEYEVAIETIKHQNPTVLFLDGRVVPLSSDFHEIPGQMSTINQIEIAVKEMYRDLVAIAERNNVLLCGIIKDSRSRNLTQYLSNHIPDWIRGEHIKSSDVKGWRVNLSNMLDHNLSAGILVEGERTCWIRNKSPDWLSITGEYSIWTCLVRPLIDDLPIKIEVMHGPQLDESTLGIALGAISVLTKHGMPIAIPTVILEADDRVRLSGDHLENVINEISLAFGVSREELRKRRTFRTSSS